MSPMTEVSSANFRPLPIGSVGKLQGVQEGVDACLALSSIAAVSSLLSGQCSSIGSQLYEYHFIKYEKTWKAAQEYCTKNHSDLATVSNETDMQRLQRHPQYRSGAWIGLQRDWRWSQPRVKFNETLMTVIIKNPSSATTVSLSEVYLMVLYIYICLMIYFIY
uniref:C-type lectin domain-containing protein n=1 Tax=Sander lucioperca TaxID=283035 RepID=A0A8C9XE86_SANLU